MILLLKLLVLASFLGGPLFVTDFLRDQIGQKPAFALAFAPLALMMFGAFAISDDEPTPTARAIAWGGIAGALVLLWMNGFAAWQLLYGTPHPNSTMITLGIGIGTLVALAYLALAFRFIRRETPEPN